MSGIKLVALYPRPKDVEAFEKLYTEEHVPMAVEKIVGKTKIVASKVLASPQGRPAFLPRRRGSLPLPSGLGRLRRLSRRQGDHRSRRQNLLRRAAHIPYR